MSVQIYKFKVSSYQVTHFWSGVVEGVTNNYSIMPRNKGGNGGEVCVIKLL